MFVNLGWMAAWLAGRLTCWLPDWVTGWLVYLVSNKKLQYFFWCPTINSEQEEEAEEENWLAKNARQILTLGYSLSSPLLICFAFAAFSFHFALLFFLCAWWLRERERGSEGARQPAVKHRWQQLLQELGGFMLSSLSSMCFSNSFSVSLLLCVSFCLGFLGIF